MIREMVVRRTVTTAFASAVLTAGLAVTTCEPASAVAVPSPDTCNFGYVWREAVPGDHVCVTPSVRSQAASDNSRAASRVDPKGPYGPDSCIQGYVWREAVPSDHVCVTSAVRTQTSKDNAQAASRRIGDPVTIRANITFSSGIACGGWSELKLYGDGTYVFTGHFHNSGAADYKTAMAWLVRASDGTAFAFSDKGETFGTFSPGSRDHDWNRSGRNEALQQAWPSVQAGWKANWRAGVTWDLSGWLNTLEQGLEAVGTVVTVVGTFA